MVNMQTTGFFNLILLLAVPRRLFGFGSLVVLDVVFCNLSLFLLYINIKIGKIDVKCKNSRWPPVCETAVHLAVAGNVFDGCFAVKIFVHSYYLEAKSFFVFVIYVNARKHPGNKTLITI